MPDIKTIADKADVIINGYAFKEMYLRWSKYSEKGYYEK